MLNRGQRDRSASQGFSFAIHRSTQLGETGEPLTIVVIFEPPKVDLSEVHITQRKRNWRDNTTSVNEASQMPFETVARAGFN